MRFQIAIGVILLATNVSGIAVAPQSDPDWEMICAGKIRPLSKKFKFDANTRSVVKDTIQLCTKHVYEFSGQAGQQIRLRLEGSKRTRMILDQRKGKRLFSELREWEGILPPGWQIRIDYRDCRDCSLFNRDKDSIDVN